MPDETPIKSKIVQDLLRYVPQVIIPALLAFISVPVYTRLFNPAAYGDFNIVRVSNSLLDRASSWIGCSLTRYYNDYAQEDRLPYILTVIMKVNLVIGLFFVIPGFILLSVIDVSSELGTLFKVGLLLFLVQLFYNTLSNVLRMERRINKQSVFILISSVVSFAVSLLLVLVFRMSIESILIGNLAVNLLLLPFLWRSTVATFFRMRISIDTALVKKFAMYGVPLTISSLGIWILDLSDRYIIKLMLDSHEVGVYSACYNVVWNSLFLIVNVFFMMEEPLAMKIFAKEGKAALADFIRCETRLFLITIVPLTSLVCCYSDELLSIMVARKYLAGSAIVPYVAISVILIGLVYKYHLGILAMERTKSLMHVVLISGAANVLLNLFLVPRMGILGAGVATLLSYLLYLLLVVLAARKAFSWDFPFKSLIRTTVSAIVAVYGLQLLTPAASLPVQVVVALFSAAVYLVLLRLCKEINDDEMNHAKLSLKSWSRKVYALIGG